MRLMIDTVNVSSPGGMTLIRELPRCVEHGCPPGSEVVLLAAPGELDVESTDRLRLVEVPRSGGWLGIRRWAAGGLVEAAREHRADVVLCISGILSRKLSAVAGTVTYINNMLPFTPEHVRYFPWTASFRWKMEILQRVFVAGCRAADVVVAPSRFGVEAADRYSGGGVLDRSYVAPNPIPEYVKYDPDRPPRHPYGGRPFLFYLSVVFWYKNHLNLVEAYRRAVERGHDLPDLLMAGPGTDRAYVEKLERAIAESGLGDRVKYLGKVPLEDIPGYLHHATIDVFPSTCETSSLVQSEILGAHGVQACSDYGPMPEIAGGTAELFDPHDPDDIARVLVELSGNEERRAELRKLAAARAATLTVEACWDVIWEAAERAERDPRARLGRA